MLIIHDSTIQAKIGTAVSAAGFWLSGAALGDLFSGVLATVSLIISTVLGFILAKNAWEEGKRRKARRKEELEDRRRAALERENNK
jgi:hypothetical protein